MGRSIASGSRAEHAKLVRRSSLTVVGSAREAAVTFLRAIIWGEHTVIWKLLSPSGREVALSVACSNGLDRVVAGRIENGLADPTELDEFLAQLLRGLRRDLRSVNISEVVVSSVDEGVDERSDQVAVATLQVPSAMPGSDGWAAGELDLSRIATGWAVDRLRPRVAGR